MLRFKRIFDWSMGLAVGLLLVIQAVPYGHGHVNPSTDRAPEWDSPRTEELARRVCFNCHSNETRWPWYSRLAPFSWWVRHDVEEGRDELNFSRFDLPQPEPHEAAEEVEEGEMPPWEYLVLHPEARLSGEERRDLVRGLEQTLGKQRPRFRRRSREHSYEDHD